MVLVYSVDDTSHKHHVDDVFNYLKETGLTLHGKELHIQLSQVMYLDHVFSATGITLDKEKV